MDYRILTVAVLGLVLLAFGGFYYALSPKSYDVAAPPTKAAQAPAQPKPADAPPARATAASIEAEIARSDHAELQGLLKQHFGNEYRELIEVAVRRRNEGASGDASGEELSGRFQEIMRPKLKLAANASVAMIDKLAANEIGLFHALGTEATEFCLKVLGRDVTPAAAPLPQNIRHLMRLGTLYRFQAIVDGMPQSRPLEPLAPEEMSTFEAGLARSGLRFEDVRNGAFLTQGGDEPGKPCLMIEKLYNTIAGLPEETRRKLYAGMYFLGRDK